MQFRISTWKSSPWYSGVADAFPGTSKVVEYLDPNGHRIYFAIVKVDGKRIIICQGVIGFLPSIRSNLLHFMPGNQRSVPNAPTVVS